METTAFSIVCLLLAAAPPEPAGGDKDAQRGAKIEAATPLAPVQTPNVRAGEAESLIRSLADPAQIALAGAPTRLADLISRLVDRRQQIEATQAYWKLSCATSEYRVWAECVASLQRLQPAEGAERFPGEEVLAARLAAAEARLREAEAEVLAEQYLLAELARWTNSNALPLPADLPHVGPYLTHFQEIYSGRVPPPRAYLIDRSLPLRLRSLETRAAAVTAASHAVEGDFDGYGRQQLDQTVLLDSIAELAAQQREFLRAVRDYNRDIAEYALSVAPANLPPAKLVSLLIQPAQRAVSQGEEPEGLRQAGFDAPLSDDRTGRSVRTSPPAGAPALGSRLRNEPTLAPPESEAGESAAVDGEAGAEAAGKAGAAAENEEQSGDPGPGAQAAEEGKSGEAEDGKASNSDPFSKQPAGAGQKGGGKKSRYKAQKPAEVGEGDAAGEAPLGLYPALVDLSPQKRTQELGTTLHWSHQLPAEPGDAVTLLDCLAWLAPGGNLAALVDAYWNARYRAARYQVLAQQREQLQSLDPAALAWRNRPDGAEAMLRLKAAQRTAEAELADAELDLRLGQFALAQAGGRSLSAAWPLPATAPHAGRIRLKLEAQPPQIAALPKMQRLSATIPKWHEVLEQQSAAVLQADIARAEATHRFEQGASPLDEPLAEIRAQTVETLAFLETQNQYNLQIADYVLTVLPPGTDRSVVAGALVVARPGK